MLALNIKNHMPNKINLPNLAIFRDIWKQISYQKLKKFSRNFQNKPRNIDSAISVNANVLENRILRILTNRIHRTLSTEVFETKILYSNNRGNLSL